MKFTILTIFPKLLDSYFNEGMLKRAQTKEIIDIKTVDLRDFSDDKRQTVDDTPYGGGAGMILKIEPLYKALKKLTNNFKKTSKKNKRLIILLSASGKTFTQQTARDLTSAKEIIFICGRYEGVDARIAKFIDAEISVGDYVLTGGELGAGIIIDAVSRLLPGVLGNSQSSVDESHSQIGILEYPQYTKPEIFRAGSKKYPVPKILLSGDHQKIATWRKENRK